MFGQNANEISKQVFISWFAISDELQRVKLKLKGLQGE